MHFVLVRNLGFVLQSEVFVGSDLDSCGLEPLMSLEYLLISYSQY